MASLSCLALLFAAMTAEHLAEEACDVKVQSSAMNQHSMESILIQTMHEKTARLPPPYNLSEELLSPLIEADARLGIHPLELIEGFAATLRSAPSEEELEIFRLTQELRLQGFTCPDGTRFEANSAPFLFDCRLWRAARLWSNEMASNNFFSHRRDSSTPCTRTNDQGFPFMQGCGENIAAGNAAPDATMKQWKESNGHCLNMMNKDYNRFGAGHVYNAASQWRHYWTQSFGVDSNPADTSCLSPGDGGSAGPAPPALTPAPQPVPQPVPGTCEDTVGSCDYYRSQGYCENSANVQKHCKKTCGMCEAGNDGGNVGGECEDTVGSCDYYQSQGFCQNNSNVRTHCKKTCGLCGGSGGGCEDTVGSCDYYRSQGYCQTSDNVKTHCKKTCGTC